MSARRRPWAIGGDSAVESGRLSRCSRATPPAATTRSTTAGSLNPNAVKFATSEAPPTSSRPFLRISPPVVGESCRTLGGEPGR